MAILKKPKLISMTLDELKSQANIKTVKNWEKWYGFDCKDGVGGFYMKGTNNIVICDDGKNYKFPLENTKDFTTNHELGHFFYDKYIDTKSKWTYEKMYKVNSKSTNPSFYRDYGKNNLEESFADDFARWAMWINDGNKVENVRKNYLQTLLKRANPKWSPSMGANKTLLERLNERKK